MSLIAMVWNLVFNYLFDKRFTGKREERGLGLRVKAFLSILNRSILNVWHKILIFLILI